MLSELSTLPSLTVSDRSGNNESESGKSEMTLGATECDDDLRDIKSAKSLGTLALSSTAKFSFEERGELIRRDGSRSSSGVREPLVPIKRKKK